MGNTRQKNVQIDGQTESIHSYFRIRRLKYSSSNRDPFSVFNFVAVRACRYLLGGDDEETESAREGDSPALFKRGQPSLQAGRSSLPYFLCLPLPSACLGC